MKKLLFHFNEYTSRIFISDTEKRLFQELEIDNKYLFIDSDRFADRLMEIIKKFVKTKFHEMYFIFSDEIDKSAKLIVNNRVINNISYRNIDTRIFLESMFSKYVYDEENIILISELEFYLSVNKIDDNKYPILFISDNHSLDANLVWAPNHIIRPFQNDRKFVDDKTAEELIARTELLKSLDDSTKNLIDEFTTIVIKVIDLYELYAFTFFGKMKSIIFITNRYHFLDLKKFDRKKKNILLILNSGEYIKNNIKVFLRRKFNRKLIDPVHHFKFNMETSQTFWSLDKVFRNTYYLFFIYFLREGGDLKSLYDDIVSNKVEIFSEKGKRIKECEDFFMFAVYMATNVYKFKNDSFITVKISDQTHDINVEEFKDFFKYFNIKRKGEFIFRNNQIMNRKESKKYIEAIKRFRS